MKILEKENKNIRNTKKKNKEEIMAAEIAYIVRFHENETKDLELILIKLGN